ncbi:MFS transporter [uncultured Shewanella sp.]|uniref:MFS transporter n=1 Tax=uncultured Shewanella sp. TaxID=173975 RepID=UPI00260D2659|nr:MFS transporter [uncultured Shewanella sp.]
MPQVYEKRRVLLLSSLGGMLEYFDFVIFALFSVPISQAFFPHHDPVSALLATFSAFAIGYLARPLGGVIFGHFGDKYGRKTSLTVAILLIGFCTFMIGLLPTYVQVGALAPMLLVLCRLLQGLSIGGEVPGAITYMSEYWPERRGLCCGIIFCFLLTGTTLGLFLQAMMHGLLSQASIAQWGWRLPFWIGGLFGIIAYFLRKRLLALPSFVPFMDKTTQYPIVSLFKRQKKRMLVALVFVLVSCLPGAVLFIFLPTYLNQVIQFHDNTSFLQALAMFIGAILCVLVGYWADKFNQLTLLVIFSIVTLCSALPIFIIYVHATTYLLWALLLSAVVLGLGFGNALSLLASLFPANTRYSAVGLIYNLATGVGSGLTPLILLSGITYFNAPLFPAYFLIVMNSLLLLAMWYTRN